MAGEANWGQAPPGCGAVWIDQGCNELEGTPAQQLQTLVNFLREMEIRCARCQVRHVGTCRQCHIGRCTQCQQAEEQCEVCGVSIKSTPNLEDSDEKHSTPAWDGKRQKGVEAIRSVNMHQLAVNFVQRMLDVRRRPTDDGKAAPGESLEFLAQIRGWQSEERKKRKAQLLQLNDIGLRAALGHAVGTDVFFIPNAHFAKETPEQGDKEWWYHVRSVIRCRECRNV
jgi:hypothetical protein